MSISDFFSKLSRGFQTNQRNQRPRRNRLRRLIIESLEGRRVLTSGVPFELFDAVTVPNLPSGWSQVGNVNTWNTVAGGSHTANNHAFISDSGTSGRRVTTLQSPVFIPTNDSSIVNFANSYNTNLSFDGGFLEISIPGVNGGQPQDILLAGGSFLTGGYDNIVSSTLPGGDVEIRDAWTGNSGGYIATSVQLPASAIGQSVSLVWRFLTRGNEVQGGWRIDSIALAGPIKPIDLATLAPTQGTTIFGAGNEDRSGTSVSIVGDVNGDGYDDMVIGAPKADGLSNASPESGESFLVFGSASLPGSTDLDTATSTIRIPGVNSGDETGESVASAGDINGDGFGDIVIGAPLGDIAGRVDCGKVYVIFGKADWSGTSSIDLLSLGTAGITIFGAGANDRSGRSVSIAGDVNGDGFDDLILGADFADGVGDARSYSGEIYLIFGKADWSANQSVDLANLGSAGIVIFGAEANDRSGRSVSSAGDINGDGFDDLAIGAFSADGQGNARDYGGETYVLFGKPDWTGVTSIDLATLNVSNGITILGAETGDRSGFSVSRVGDVNGDGFDDLAIGAYLAGGAGNGKAYAGDSYIVYGKADWSSTPTIDLANLGAAGITVFGADGVDLSGQSISGGGDLNGDGFDDLVIGAKNGDAALNLKSNSGDTYVVFGGATLPPTIDLANLGNGSLAIFGANNIDRSGVSVSLGGDVNGDGFDDLLIGAYLADSVSNGRSNAGESYLVFGGNGFTNSILPANIGTSGDNTINGTFGTEILVGGDGNDTLKAFTGGDVLLGGRGDDIIAVNVGLTTDFKRIVGGNGGRYPPISR